MLDPFRKRVVAWEIFSQIRLDPCRGEYGAYWNEKKGIVKAHMGLCRYDPWVHPTEEDQERKGTGSALE